MPEIIGTTTEESNGTFTKYSGTATEVSQNFTFSKTQNGMHFSNKGDSILELTVDGKTHRIPSRSSINVDDKKFSSFDIKTKNGSSDFVLTSFSLKGSDIDTAALDEINAQLAETMRRLPVISVTEYENEVVNGDWYPAIQHALNDVKTIGKGVVIFPYGLYEISQAIVIPVNCTLISEAKTFNQKGAFTSSFYENQMVVIRLKDGANTNVIEFDGGIPLNVVISGLTIDGNKAGQTVSGLYGIYVPDNTVSQLTGLRISNTIISSVKGIGLYIGKYINEYTIEHFISREHDSHGIVLNGCKDNKLTQLGSGDNGGDGLRIIGFGGGYKAFDLDFWGNNVGLYVEDVQDLQLFRVQTDKNKKQGVVLNKKSSLNDVTFTAGVFKDNSSEGNGLYSNVLISTETGFSPDGLKFLGCKFGEGTIIGKTKYAVEDTGTTKRRSTFIGCTFNKNEFVSGISNALYTQQFIGCMDGTASPIDAFPGYIRGGDITRTPDSSQGGDTKYNSTKKRIETYDGGFWRSFVEPPFSFTSADKTVNDSEYTISVDGNGGARTITLPDPSTLTPGRRFEVYRKDASANNVTVTSAGTATINGASTYLITEQYKKYTFQRTSGSSWEVIK